jgi:hypothetical protein
MKLTRILPFILILSACTPATPVTPSVTSVPPTAATSPAPTQTMTAEPTSTPEPTATPEPTKVPMPEGWTAVAETKEIGGRQVVLNEEGDAATRIDGEWYPVDARGCFYKEFFDPANQADPRIDELIQKINSGEPVFPMSNDSLNTRYLGGNHTAHINWTKLNYVEKTVDAILFNQKLCYNELSGEWEHVLEYVNPYDSTTTPDATKIMRAVVGWLRNDKLVSFTYREQISDHKKANTIREAFGLWEDLISSKKQVAVALPLNIDLGTNGVITEKGYADAVGKLMPDAVEKANNRDFDIDKIFRDLQDPDFMEWILTDNNQVRFRSDRKNWVLMNKNHENIWRNWGEQASTGEQPEPVVRMVVDK